jgi:hypothetical protein
MGLNDANTNKTSTNKLSALTFNSEIISRLFIDSSFTQIINEFAKLLRTKEEKDVVNDLKRYY